jgi:4-hydroxy-tetrahydrodipicolinate reductase
VNPRRYSVVQWATGNSGTRTMREVIRHPTLDLVGVLAYDPAKDGTDAGKLCGEDPVGVTATTDRTAVLALKPDCVVYMPRASGTGPSRAGLSLAEVVDDAVEILEAGTNIVTICTDFHAGGVRLGEEGRARVLDACERGNASLYATGSNPGFMTDALPYVLLSMQRRVSSIEIEEFGDVSRRPSPHMLFDQMRFGKPLTEFHAERRAAHLLGEFGPPLGALAEAAGFTVDEWTAVGEVAAATHDVSMIAGELEAGTAAAQRSIMVGRAGGVEVVRFTQYAYCTRDVDPAWDLRPAGWRIRVRGDAPFDVDLTFPVPLAELGDYVPAYNGNRAINAIPYVCAAKPGILSIENLPPILPAPR